jgi:hypothetical protein
MAFKKNPGLLKPLRKTFTLCYPHENRFEVRWCEVILRWGEWANILGEPPWVTNIGEEKWVSEIEWGSRWKEFCDVRKSEVKLAGSMYAYYHSHEYRKSFMIGPLLVSSYHQWSIYTSWTYTIGLLVTTKTWEKAEKRAAKDEETRKSNLFMNNSSYHR